MTFYDISMPLRRDMVVWAGQEKFWRRELQSGEAIVSQLRLSSHTGTHIDAPKHFLGRAAVSVERIAMGKLIGPCRVVERLENLRPGGRILWKTKNSQRRLLLKKNFTSDYVSLDLAAAKYLAKKKITLIGVDYLGVEAKGSPGHPVHKALLKSGIVVVEGLDLSRVKPGRYNLAVLPLRIRGGDGAPARAVLWK